MTVKLQSGQNELFMSPNVEEARGFFRTKSRAMTSKLTTVKDAVKDLLKDGEYFALGGFGANRIPTAVAHEILRQKKKNLGFLGHTSTHDFQILMASDCINRLDIAYIIGLESRGLSKNARTKIESGKIKLTEWTNAALSWRLKAAAMGVPFVPARNILGTDTFRYSAAKEITCPFTGQKLVAYPAIFPDFAAIHVNEADEFGNCRIKGVAISDQDLAKASKKVLITAEKIVPTETFRQNPESTFIPYWCVDAVCEVRYGSYPGNMPGEYFSDEEHLSEWLKTEKDPEAFQAFIQKQIYETQDFNDYLKLNGGEEKMKELKALETMYDEEEGRS